MKKITATVVALLIMGTVSFAQNTKMGSKKKTVTKKETKMNAKGEKSIKASTETKETKMNAAGKRVKSSTKKTSTMQSKMK